MGKALVLFVTLAGYLLFLPSNFGAPQEGSPNRIPPRPFREGSVLVKFRDGANIVSAAESKGLKVKKVLGHRLAVLAVPAGTELRQAKLLSVEQDVEIATPDLLVPLAATPNDSLFSLQQYLLRIDIPRAWDLTKGSREIKVAVLDTGFDLDHLDLYGAYALPGRNIPDGNGDVAPVHQHGTWVSGVINGVGDNAYGIAGIGMGRIRIVPVRVSNQPDGSAYIGDILEGMEWAALRGARVVSISYDVIDSADLIASQASYLDNSLGCLTVVASGNRGRLVGRRDDEGIIYVSATSMNSAADEIAGYSSYGEFVDISAPGEVYTTSPGNRFSAALGSSFAAPQVTGVIALMLSANPSLPPSEVRSRLFAACADRGDPGRDPQYGHGLLDAFASVSAARGEGNTVLGDINGDGRTGVPDLVLLIRHLSGNLPLGGAQRKAADLVRDGVVDTRDLIRLIQTLQGIN